jgi:hypothetical protein
MPARRSRIDRSMTRTLVAAAAVCGVATVVTLSLGGSVLRSGGEQSHCPSFHAPARSWLMAGGATALTPYCGNVIAVVGSLAPRTGAFAKLSIASGKPSLDFAQVLRGSVRAAVDDGNGGWFIGGDFAQIDGKECPFLAHIFRSGSFDEDWCPGPNGAVNALARRGSTLFVGGKFTSLLGKRRLRLAAVDTRRPFLRAWAPSVSGEPVYDRHTLIPREVKALAIVGGTVYVGGFFRTVGGSPRENLAAADAATGHVRPWRVRVGGPDEFAPFVSAITATPRGLYVVGGFDLISAVKRAGVAAIGYDGLVKQWNRRHARLTDLAAS